MMEQPRPLRILLINPNSSPSMTRDMKAAAMKSVSVAIDSYTAPLPAPASINDDRDLRVSTKAVLDDAALADCLASQDYDAVLVACFSIHPLVNELAKRLQMPVTGIFEASIVTALTIVPAAPPAVEQWGIVTTGEFWEKHLSDGIATFLGYDPSTARRKEPLARRNARLYPAHLGGQNAGPLAAPNTGASVGAFSPYATLNTGPLAAPNLGAFVYNAFIAPKTGPNTGAVGGPSIGPLAAPNTGAVGEFNIYAALDNANTGAVGGPNTGPMGPYPGPSPKPSPGPSTSNKNPPIGPFRSRKFAGVFSTGLTAADFHAVSPGDVGIRLCEATRRLLHSGNITCVVMGCGGMTGLEDIIRSVALEVYGEKRAYSMYVVDGVQAGVMQLKHTLLCRQAFVK